MAAILLSARLFLAIQSCLCRLAARPLAAREPSRLSNDGTIDFNSLLSHIYDNIRLLSDGKSRTGNTTPMYYWVFNAEIPGWDNPGAFHSVDLWFFFETLAKCWRPFVGKHFDLARMMRNCWANFIRSGDPNGRDANGSDMPLWKPFTQADPHRMFFCDRVYSSNKGPDDVMKFQIRQYLRKHN